MRRLARFGFGWLAVGGLVVACSPLVVSLAPSQPVASLLPGAGPTAPGAKPSLEPVPHVEVAAVAARMKQGEVFVPVDVRAAQSYETEHIEGAVHATDDAIAAGRVVLPTDQTLLLYCT